MTREDQVIEYLNRYIVFTKCTNMAELADSNTELYRLAKIFYDELVWYRKP